MTSIATPCIKRAAFPLLLLLIGLALFGCRSSESEETATALSAAVRVELESLRATATVARARMQTTLDYVGTRIVQVEESGEFLSHSLNNLGTDSAFIEESLRQIADFATEAAPTEAPRAESRSSATAAPTARPAPVIVTPPDASPPPSATQTGPRFENIVTASGVDSNDCARDVNPPFTPQSSEIYVVAQAYNIPGGATIAASWQRGGGELALISFESARIVDGSCIWLFIDQSDVIFSPGSWSVELRVNGLPVAPPLAFQIEAS